MDSQTGMGFSEMAKSQVFTVPIWIVMLMTLLAFYLFNNRPLGRYTYGIGANEESVLRAGVNVRFIKLKVYLFSGCMVGLAAVILSSRINSAHPGIGVGYELDAIAAAGYRRGEV